MRAEKASMLTAGSSGGKKPVSVVLVAPWTCF
jgi:hypothetical protein